MTTIQLKQMYFNTEGILGLITIGETTALYEIHAVAWLVKNATIKADVDAFQDIYDQMRASRYSPISGSDAD